MQSSIQLLIFELRSKHGNKPVFYKVVLFLFLYVALSSSILCQSPDVTFEKFTTSRGLSSNTVYSTVQDELGFIWLGTKSGLNRFDGYEFKSYPLPMAENETVDNVTVFSLLVDKKGVMWIGLKDQGLLAFDQLSNTFRRYPFEENWTVDWNTITVKEIYEDSRGWLWIGTYGGGAIVLDEERKVKYHFCTYCNKAKNEILSNDFVFDFQEDKNKNVYVATAGKGLNLFITASKSIKQIHADVNEDLNSFSKSLCLAQNGDLWIGTEGNGLYKFDVELNKWTNFLESSVGLSTPSNIIRDIQLDDNGELWVATDGGGLLKYNDKEESFTQYSYDPLWSNLLNTNALYDLFFDRSNNLWIGTFNGGINVLKSIQSPFYLKRQFEEEKKIGIRSVLAVKEDSNGRVWLGTDGGGLFYFNINDENLTVKNISESVSSVITCIEIDSTNKLWYGSFAEGLGNYDYQTNVNKNFTHNEMDLQSIVHNNVWDIEATSSGDFWIGTLGGGVDFFPKTDEISQQLGNIQEKLSSVQVIDILLDKEERYLWIATEDKGLNRLEISTNEVVMFNHNDSITQGVSSNNVEALFEDHEGSIWVISNAGVDKVINKETVKSYFFKDFGIENGTISSIQQDDEGYIWVASSKGISRVDNDNKTMIEFGSEHFLQHNFYNAKASCLLSDGRIVFGGVMGFSVVVPKKVQLNDNAALPVFSDLKISGKSVLVGDYDGRKVLQSDLNDENTLVRFSYLDRGISFELSAVEFSDPERNKFAYKLEGFDSEWQILDANHRSIYFSSLKGGEYSLKIKAANSSGVWNENIRTLKILVTPPFWQTWWFITLAVFVILSMIYILYKFLLNRQKEQYELQAMAQREEILKSKQEILQLKNVNLQEEIANKKGQLNASVLQIAHKNEFLTVLKGRIRKIQSETDSEAAKPLRSVVNIINTELKQRDYWEEFQILFNKTFQDFVEDLSASYPTLTSNDHRLCSFIKMKLNNREIASILNITVSAVEQAKYRLKKKISLEKSESLNDFVQHFGKNVQK